ncbi:MAG: chemotaxis protein CheD [Deltaproteobacteria bacterium]|nr:chemotaxis protein CheD [Deltaproteobacteria bacterium]
MKEIQRVEYFLEPGYIYVTSTPTIIQTVLGISVAVCIFDSRLCCAGINHYVYARIVSPEKATVRYGNVAIPTLLKVMIEAGSRIQDMEHRSLEVHILRMTLRGILVRRI